MIKYHLLPFAGILILMSGCTHSYYAPNTSNVPVFKEKNEMHFSGSVVATQNVGGDLQAAYAPTNSVGVIANANVNGGGNTPTTGGKGYLFELGGGYYKPLNVNTPHAKNVLVFECYGILGLGGSRGFYRDSTGQLAATNIWGQTIPQQFFYPHNYILARYMKAYVQPSISFSHNIIDLIFATKIGFLYTYKVSSTIPESYLTTAPAAEPAYAGTLYSDYQTLTTNRAPFLFEPSFTLRVGYKWVKFEWQLDYSATRNAFMQNVAGIPLAYSFGVSVDIARRFKKEPKHASGNELDY